MLELIAFLDDPQPDQAIRAVPGYDSKVPVWILGSSLYGAQLAAALGLPFAFALHFALAMLEQPVEIYRRQFQPSEFSAQVAAKVARQAAASTSDYLA